jgi:hypothetical protein
MRILASEPLISCSIEHVSLDVQSKYVALSYLVCCTLSNHSCQPSGIILHQLNISPLRAAALGSFNRSEDDVGGPHFQIVHTLLCCILYNFLHSLGMAFRIGFMFCWHRPFSKRVVSVRSLSGEIQISHALSTLTKSCSLSQRSSGRRFTIRKTGSPFWHSICFLDRRYLHQPDR